MKTKEPPGEKVRFIGITRDEAYRLIESLLYQLNPANKDKTQSLWDKPPSMVPFLEKDPDGLVVLETFIIVNDD